MRSEGVAVLVLKALDRAVADGDRIYAVIRGSAINNDGRSSGSMGTPSRIGQEELLRSAYRDAGLPAGQVDYIEAHGTGTRAGDPVELGALAAVLGEGRDARASLSMLARSRPISDTLKSPPGWPGSSRRHSHCIMARSRQA